MMQVLPFNISDIWLKLDLRCDKAECSYSRDDEVFTVGDGQSWDDENHEVSHLVRHEGEEVERGKDDDDASY